LTVDTLRRTVAEDRRLVNRWLVADLRLGRDVPGVLAKAMRYAVLGRGKRVRAVLALEAYRAAGGDGLERIRPFCTGIEMIHAFSLVHDDLPSMDDDDFRRGKPSLHRRYDEATAILAADALFALAFELFAAGPAPAARRAGAIAAVARAVGPSGMAGGQVLDLASGVRRGPRVLDRLHAKKTAEFMAAALVVGAGIAGADRRLLERLHEAGLKLGMLFQTTDDLLDAGREGDAGKLTVVSEQGLAGARSQAGREAEEAAGMFRVFGPAYALLAAYPELVLRRKR
jgi:farnesyl diphosphate synthase